MTTETEKEGRTRTFTFSEREMELLLEIARQIRDTYVQVEGAVQNELRGDNRKPSLNEMHIRNDPRVEKQLRLLAFCEIADAFQRGKSVSILPIPQVSAKIHTPITRETVPWEDTLRVLTEIDGVGGQITEALENGQFVILQPPTPLPG